MSSLTTTLKLTQTTLTMLLRNRQALFFTLFTPLLIMIILGLIGFDKPQQFDIGLVVSNPQSATQQFIDQIKGIPVLKVHQGTQDAEIKALRNGDRSIVVTVPDDFITTSADQPSQLSISINESKQAEAQAIISILSHSLDKLSLNLAHAPTYFTIHQEVIDSKNLKYIDFLLPGLIAMSVMQMAIFSVMAVFVQYKEKGILKRLMATPMEPGQFVIANVITRLIVSVAQAAVFLAVGVLILKAHVLGSYALVGLCVVLGALMFLGLGFTISGLAKSMDAVPVFGNLVVFPMLFLGGVFFSTSSMPNWLQTFSKFLPLTHFSSALREVMTQGAGIGAIAGDLLAMAAWAVVLITIATITFSMQEKDSA